MPDLLVAGRDREPLPWTWRRARSTDAVAVALVVSLALAVTAVSSHRPTTVKAVPVAPPAYGSRPNLDLPPGANLRTATGGRSVRYDRTPSAEGLDAAVGNAVYLLCGGAELDAVVSRDVSAGFGSASYVVRARVLGMPTKEQPEIGTVALHLLFRRDGYDVAANRRSGACRSG